MAKKTLLSRQPICPKCHKRIKSGGVMGVTHKYHKKCYDELMGISGGGMKFYTGER